MLGACDRSFGIHVAELAHFPSHVIQVTFNLNFDMRHIWILHFIEQFAKQKAEDLEGTHGFWDVADDAVPAAKRQKTEKEVRVTVINSSVVVSQSDGDKTVQSLGMLFQFIRKDLR